MSAVMTNWLSFAWLTVKLAFFVLALMEGAQIVVVAYQQF